MFNICGCIHEDDVHGFVTFWSCTGLTWVTPENVSCMARSSMAKRTTRPLTDYFDGVLKLVIK